MSGLKAALTLVNANPGAELAAQSAVRLRRRLPRLLHRSRQALAARRRQSPHEIAAGGEFQTATPDGSLAFYTKGGNTSIATKPPPKAPPTSLPPAESKASSAPPKTAPTVYFQAAGGLQEWHEGALTQVAPGPQPPSQATTRPTTGTARVSSDGQRLLFLSTESLTGYDNTTPPPANPTPRSSSGTLPAAACACISCNPTGERPLGPSTISGAYANGASPGSADSYKPRNLSATPGPRLL